MRCGICWGGVASVHGLRAPGLMAFDWSAYYGSYTPTDLIGVAAVGLAPLVTVLVVFVSARWGVQLVGDVAALLRSQF